MKWAKAKTIFIYIFIFVNLFLFVVYRMNTFEGKQINTANVVELLKHYGVVSSTEVFKNFPNRMKQIEAVNISGEKEFLENLLGSGYKVKKTVASRGSRSFDIASGIYKDSAPEDKGFKNINISNAEGKIKTFLENAGVNKKNLRPYGFKNGMDGSVSGFIGYESDGFPVFGCDLKIVAEKNGITDIKGRFLKFSQVEKRYYNVCPAESVILDYLSLFGNKYGKGAEITEISAGYFVPGEISSASSYAIPVYQFTFSNNKKLYLDARENIESAYKLLMEE